jgi:hypothetical protein
MGVPTWNPLIRFRRQSLRATALRLGMMSALLEQCFALLLQRESENGRAKKRHPTGDRYDPATTRERFYLA